MHEHEFVLYYSVCSLNPTTSVFYAVCHVCMSIGHRVYTKVRLSSIFMIQISFFLISMFVSFHFPPYFAMQRMGSRCHSCPRAALATAAWPSKVIENCQVHEYDRSRTTAQLDAQSIKHIHRHLVRFLFKNNKFNNTKHQHSTAQHYSINLVVAQVKRQLQQLHRFIHCIQEARKFSSSFFFSFCSLSFIFFC